MNTGDIWGNRSQSGRESKLGHNSINKAKGFTLVELIVVLVILAILAAIAVPTFISFIDKGKEKKAQLSAQRALTATQTALSDIYADAGNRYTPAKRAETRTLAAVDSEENGNDTGFTVWTENRLWDGKTIAITENIGSYIVSKALYSEPKNSYYVAYDGKDWTIFDAEDKAKEFLDISNTKGNSKDLTDNVIYVWEWQQDYAYIPGLDPDDPTGGGEGASSVKVLTLRLPSETLGNVFFSPSGYNNNSGKESVSIVFWQDEDGNVSCNDWRVVNSVDTFATDDTHSYWINVVNSEDKTYRISGWLLEDGSPLSIGFASDLIGPYIFGNSFADINRITLTADVNEGTIVSLKATMGKTELQNVIKSSSASQIQGIRRVTGGLAGNTYTKELFEAGGVGGAVKVDRNEAADEEGVIYAWVSADGWVEWWSDATTVYLPAQNNGCYRFFRADGNGINKKICSFDFSEFDVSRVGSMEEMFNGQKELTSISVGDNFYANSLTTTSGMFADCNALTTIDMSKFNAEMGSLTDVKCMFQRCWALSRADFGPGFNTQNVTTFFRMFWMDNKDNTAMTTLNVSGFNTENATNMESMFYRCAGVKSLDLSGWDMAKVTTLLRTFQGMKGLETLSIGTGWNLQECTTMQSAFEGCVKLSNQDFGNIKSSNKLANLWATFKDCGELTRINLSGMNASGLVTLDQTFLNCAKVETINLAGEGWNTPNLKYMTQTFKSCTKLTSLDLSNWDLRNILIMDHTFAEDKALRNLSLPSGEKCHLNSCKTLWYTFERCSILQGQDFKDMHVGTALGGAVSSPYYITPGAPSDGTIEGVFSECSSLTHLELGNWDVRNVTSMHKSFYKCSSLIWLDVSNWQTGNLKTMSYTFSGCANLDTLNLKNWDLTSVETMEKTFMGDTDLISIRMGDGWQLNNCKTMEATFDSCTNLTQSFREITTTNKLTNIRCTFKNMSHVQRLDLRGFNTQGVTSDCVETFKGCTNLRTINATQNFTIPKANHNANMFEGCNNLVGENNTAYASNPNNRNSSQYAWLDGQDRSDPADNRGYFSTRTEAYMQKAVEGWFYASCGYTKGTIKTFKHADNITETEVQAKAGVKDLREPGTAYPVYFWREDAGSGLNHIRWWSPADVVYIHEDSSQMFHNYEKATEIDLSGLDFSRMKNFSGLFYNNKSLTTLNLEGFSTASATNMYEMFRECQKITTLDLRGLDTSNVTDMTYMFYNCNKLTSIDLSGLDTSKITSTEYMFFNCQSATKILTSRWNTSNVTNMSFMFDRCIKLEEVDVTSFDTRKVTTMENMFSNSIWNNNTVENKVLKTLDLSSFSTDSLTNIKNMFTRQRALTTVYVNPEEWKDAETQFWMGSQNAQGPGWTAFKGCNAIKGAEGTFIPSGKVNNNVLETSGVFARVDEPADVDVDGNGTAGEKGYFTDIKDKPTE